MNDENQRAFEEQDAFHSLVSAFAHEISIPVKSATFGLELLKNRIEHTFAKAGGRARAARAKVDEEIEAVAGDLERIESVLNEMLMLYRFRDGMPADLVSARPIDSSELERYIYRATRNARRQNGSEICVEKPVCEPATIQADRALLSLALGAVLKNAITYAHSGSSVRVLGKRHSCSHYSVSVENYGLFLETEDLRNATKLHWRAPQARMVAPTGMGRGLFLVDHAMLAMKGHLRIRSRQLHNDAGLTQAQLFFRFHEHETRA